MKEFNLTGEDRYVIGIAKNAARRLLKEPDIKPLQVTGIGNALYALERLPKSTPGAFNEFGIVYKPDFGNLPEMSYITFRISDSEFEITKGGVTYNEAARSDSYSESLWFIINYGTSTERCMIEPMYQLEDSIDEYLELGAEVSVSNDSEIDYD